MPKGIAYKRAGRTESPSYLGIALIFAGMVFFAVTKALVGYKFGMVTAQRIICARQKSGRFRRVEDLLAIRGMSTKRLEALRPYVTVSPLPASPAKKPQIKN